jgi:chromosome segregation ATPase
LQVEVWIGLWSLTAPQQWRQGKAVALLSLSMKDVTCHVLLQELRAKVAECHKQIGELDQHLRDKEESHAADMEERRRELQDLQERVGFT